MTGVLSPVSMDSLIITLPVKTIASHGITQLDGGTSIISPGTRLPLSYRTNSPFINVLIGTEYLAILLISFVFLVVSLNTAITEPVETTNIQRAYVQYPSLNHKIMANT
jgi:hypothetical protein